MTIHAFIGGCLRDDFNDIQFFIDATRLCNALKASRSKITVKVYYHSFWSID